MKSAGGALPEVHAQNEALCVAYHPRVLFDWPEHRAALSVWQRMLPTALSAAADELAAVDQPADFRADWIAGTGDQVTASDLIAGLAAFNPASSPWTLTHLADDALCLINIAESLASQLKTQLHSPKLSVRIERVIGDGCRLFHVDRLCARLICTWTGAGTEWLPEGSFDRSGLGCGCNDHVLNLGATRQIPTGAVALLRGDACQGQEGAGLVHRSPPGRPGRARLLIAVDLR